MAGGDGRHRGAGINSNHQIMKMNSVDWIRGCYRERQVETDLGHQIVAGNIRRLSGEGVVHRLTSRGPNRNGGKRFPGTAFQERWYPYEGEWSNENVTCGRRETASLWVISCAGSQRGGSVNRLDLRGR